MGGDFQLSAHAEQGAVGDVVRGPRPAVTKAGGVDGLESGGAVGVEQVLFEGGVAAAYEYRSGAVGQGGLCWCAAVQAKPVQGTHAERSAIPSSQCAAVTCRSRLFDVRSRSNIQ